MSTGNLSVVVLCSLSSKRTEQQQCGVMEVSIIPDHCRNVLLWNVVSCIWNGFGRGVRLYRCLIDSYRWPVFLWQKKIRLVWTKEWRLRADYCGLLWTNKSVPRLFLFKQIIANTIGGAWALALEVLALKANNGHTTLPRWRRRLQCVFM